MCDIHPAQGLQHKLALREQECWALEQTLLSNDRSSALRIAALQRALKHQHQSSARRVDALKDELAERDRELNDLQEALAQALRTLQSQTKDLSPTKHLPLASPPAPPLPPRPKETLGVAPGSARACKRGHIHCDALPSTASVCVLLLCVCVCATILASVNTTPKQDANTKPAQSESTVCKTIAATGTRKMLAKVICTLNRWSCQLVRLLLQILTGSRRSWTAGPWSRQTNI